MAYIIKHIDISEAGATYLERINFHEQRAWFTPRSDQALILYHQKYANGVAKRFNYLASIQLQVQTQAGAD